MRKTVLRAEAELATRFVNLKSEQLAGDFLREYKNEIRPGENRSTLYLLAWSLQGIWNKRAWSGLRGLAIGPVITLERIFAGWPEKIHKKIDSCPTETVSVSERGLRESDEEYAKRLAVLERIGIAKHLYQRGEVSIPAQFKKMEHPAFRIRLGESRPVFEARDILDEICLAILTASEHGLLKKCKGYRRGWRCPMPYLVADEHRRVYCYKDCGDEAKSRATKQWKKRHKQLTKFRNRCRTA